MRQAQPLRVPGRSRSPTHEQRDELAKKYSTPSKPRRFLPTRLGAKLCEGKLLDYRNGRTQRTATGHKYFLRIITRACRGQSRQHHVRTRKRQRQESEDQQADLRIRADVVRNLDRGEPEPETLASSSAASSEALDASDPAPF